MMVMSSLSCIALCKGAQSPIGPAKRDGPHSRSARAPDEQDFRWLLSADRAPLRTGL